MNSICITGAAQPDLQLVANILQTAGMAQAKPGGREQPVDIAFWHEQVMAAAVKESGPAQPIANVGKLWEQLAGDIFVANIESPLWGWADNRSTWLLDFWLNFDPGLKLILVCVSPQQMLASAMASETQAVSVAALMATWQAHHQALLHFQQRNPQRSMLVDVHECADYPQGLLERCIAKWKLPLTVSAASATPLAEQDPLVLYLAQQLCAEHPQTATLQRELTSAITRLRTTAIALINPTALSKLTARISRLGRTEKAVSVYAPPSEQIIANFQALRDRSAQLQHTLNEVSSLTQARDEKTKLATEKRAKIEALTKDKGALEQEKAALTKARDEQTKLAAERQAKIDAVAKERDSHAQQAAERQKQLDALTKDKGALEQEKAALTKARDEQTKLAAERQAKIDAVAKERDSHAQQAAERQKQLDALTKDKGALEQEKAALTKARDEQTKLATERQAKIDALIKQSEIPPRGNTERRKEVAALAKEKTAWEQERATLTKARDEQTKLATDGKAKIEALTKERDSHAQQATERQKQIDTLTKDTTSVQTKCQEAEQESELLLLQLHHVQEELEHYFLQNQELEQQLKANSVRWQRMLERNLDYSDYESIELIEAPAGDHQPAHWRLKNIIAADRTFAELEFQTFVLSGVAGFIFTRDEQGASPLLHWPNSNVSNEYQIPLGREATVQERIEAFFDLSSSDWKLMQKLPRVLAGILEQPAAVKASGDFNALPLRLGLDKLGQIIDRFPHSLRFDGVSLKSELVNSDYEHLWLSFENLSLGDKAYPEFELRLSCANVHTDGFGKHPKLEFPEGPGQAPLQSWFADSYDDFGAKLELRLALPESMDMEVWQKLSESDHKFLTALVMRLPAVLLTLQNAGVQPKRSWDDWHAMAREVQRILVLHTAPQPKVATAVPATKIVTAQAGPKTKAPKAR